MKVRYPTLRQLVYFETLLDTGSYEKLSRAMKVTRKTAKEQIFGLEENFGEALVKPCVGARSAELTDAGVKLGARLPHILLACREARLIPAKGKEWDDLEGVL